MKLQACQNRLQNPRVNRRKLPKQAESLVQQTVGQMNSINRSVKQAEQVVKGLEAKSKDITAILRVINGIADQTNLLGSERRHRGSAGRRIRQRLLGCR